MTVVVVVKCSVGLFSSKSFRTGVIVSRCSALSSTRRFFSSGSGSDKVAQPLLKKKATGTATQVSAFVDRRVVQVEGGKGGDGCVSFSSIFANEFAGPDGGDGGNGGHVLFKASFSCKSLADLNSRIKGNAGENGHNCNCYGKNGEHLVIPVPVGTMFKNPETGETIADLTTPDTSVFLAARGGSGGKGNKFFATPETQSPEVAEYGAEGERMRYVVEMATIAHFGLVGYPNAGKSTLLRAVSRARPKVASYPFTTLRPHVGMILYDDLEQIAVADIPGLITDAHLNRGLGIQFLRHIQRCLCLLYVIDLSTSNPSPFVILETLKDEIRHYDASMLDRPSLIVANKLDLPEAKANFSEFKSLVGESMPILPVSAKFGENLKELLVKLRTVFDEKSSKKEEEIIEKYDPVRQHAERRQWRRPTKLNQKE